MKIAQEFYKRKNVLTIAKELIGKKLCTKFNGQLTSGIISETEAYDGIIDRASHAFNGKRTQRNETMYAIGGTSYVYICYGMHHLFNVVTNEKEIPHAVLIRAIYPVDGVNVMYERRKSNQPITKLTSGPGTLSVALGINKIHDGIKLSGNHIWIEENAIEIPTSEIKITKRIGVESSKEAADYLYRFVVSNNIVHALMNKS